ncbi:hypothetical protein BDZ85DRAFT_267077 [Elsinoe ampelina]|uniref:Uncharacterized protein n=1 Tax=Elsinoe ampelina TaxID=302913 RepID=A0A6A6G4U2_9PEZI|nr:hypothetical protein BDZ85DRAFT_267077 [Elsinoe ampelina]
MIAVALGGPGGYCSMKNQGSAWWTYLILLVILVSVPCHELRSAVHLAMSICPDHSDSRHLAYQSTRTFHLASGVACQR